MHVVQVVDAEGLHGEHRAVAAATGPLPLVALDAGVDPGNLGGRLGELDGDDGGILLGVPALDRGGVLVPVGELRVVLLDTRYRLMRVESVSVGSMNESIAHPREIFRPALTYSAYAVIVVHNHPSGDPSPSQTDHSLTRRLAEAAELLQIKLLDHIIIGASGHSSLRSMGLI